MVILAPRESTTDHRRLTTGTASKRYWTVDSYLLFATIKKSSFKIELVEIKTKERISSQPNLAIAVNQKTGNSGYSLPAVPALQQVTTESSQAGLMQRQILEEEPVQERFMLLQRKDEVQHVDITAFNPVKKMPAPLNFHDQWHPGAAIISSNGEKPSEKRNGISPINTAAVQPKNPGRQVKQQRQLKVTNGMIQRMPWAQLTPVRESKIPGLIVDSIQYGGHAGDKHIYIGWAGLMERGIADASAFGDETQAYKVIAEIIKENEDKIENHIGANPNANGNFTFSKKYPDLKVLSYSQVVATAKGIPEGSIGGEVIVVLRYRRINHVGQVFLTTAYPVGLDASEFFHKKKEKHDYNRQREKSIEYGKGAQKSFNKYMDSI